MNHVVEYHEIENRNITLIAYPTSDTSYAIGFSIRNPIEKNFDKKVGSRYALRRATKWADKKTTRFTNRFKYDNICSNKLPSYIYILYRELIPYFKERCSKYYKGMTPPEWVDEIININDFLNGESYIRTLVERNK